MNQGRGYDDHVELTQESRPAPGGALKERWPFQEFGGTLPAKKVPTRLSTEKGWGALELSGRNVKRRLD